VKLKGIPVKGVKQTKAGKIATVHYYPDASAAIRAKKSKKVRPCKRTI
jgi:hypothetical protein